MVCLTFQEICCWIWNMPVSYRPGRKTYTKFLCTDNLKRLCLTPKIKNSSFRAFATSASTTTALSSMWTGLSMRLIATVKSYFLPKITFIFIRKNLWFLKQRMKTAFRYWSTKTARFCKLLQKNSSETNSEEFFYCLPQKLAIRCRASCNLALFSSASDWRRFSSSTTAAGARSTKLGLPSLRA